VIFLKPKKFTTSSFSYCCKVIQSFTIIGSQSLGICPSNLLQLNATRLINLSQACQNYTISSINKFSLFYTPTRLSNLPQTVVVILSNLIVPSAAKDTYTVKSYANFFYCRQPLYIGKSYSVIYSRQFLVQLSSLTQLSVAYSSLKLSSHTWLSITDSPC